MLSIVEAMAAHWEGETHASILAWSWSLFCTKWARLYEQLVAKRKVERERNRKRKQDAELNRRHRSDEEWFNQVARDADG